jgi:hypothetical protein
VRKASTNKNLRALAGVSQRAAIGKFDEFG